MRLLYNAEAGARISTASSRTCSRSRESVDAQGGNVHVSKALLIIFFFFSPLFSWHALGQPWDSLRMSRGRERILITCCSNRRVQAPVCHCWTFDAVSADSEEEEENEKKKQTSLKAGEGAKCSQLLPRHDVPRSQSEIPTTH